MYSFSSQFEQRLRSRMNDCVRDEHCRLICRWTFMSPLHCVSVKRTFQCLHQHAHCSVTQIHELRKGSNQASVIQKADSIVDYLSKLFTFNKNNFTNEVFMTNVIQKISGFSEPNIAFSGLRRDRPTVYLTLRSKTGEWPLQLRADCTNQPYLPLSRDSVHPSIHPSIHPSMCLLAENVHTMKITMLENDNAKWNTE